MAEITGKTRISTNFGVNSQLQAGIVVGLEAGVLKTEPAASGVAEHLPPGDAAADVMGSPPGVELGTALTEPRQQVDRVVLMGGVGTQRGPGARPALSLDHANDAVAHAAARGRPFKMTVLKPN
nr:MULTISPECIES: hypothetical protein [unclassified Bradyrhizobium]